MLSSPLMMDHVRSYYQEKSLLAPRAGPAAKGKYIWRTRARRRRKRKAEMRLIKPKTRKRGSDEFAQEKEARPRAGGAEVKLVLRKQVPSAAGPGKFCLKRVAQG